MNQCHHAALRCYHWPRSMAGKCKWLCYCHSRRSTMVLHFLRLHDHHHQPSHDKTRTFIIILVHTICSNYCFFPEKVAWCKGLSWIPTNSLSLNGRTMLWTFGLANSVTQSWPKSSVINWACMAILACTYQYVLPVCQNIHPYIEPGIDCSLN